jgi:hypothetical protein
MKAFPFHRPFFTRPPSTFDAKSLPQRITEKVPPKRRDHSYAADNNKTHPAFLYYRSCPAF